MKILLLIFLLTCVNHAQDNPYRIMGWMGGSDYYTTTAETGTNVLASTTATINGDTTATESTSALGSKNYWVGLRWWLDSTDVITNGDFASDTVGWSWSSNPSTFEWVASGGGYTGALHIVGDDANDGAQQTIGVPIASGNYNLSFDLNITSNTASGVRVRIFDGVATFPYNVVFPDVDSYSVETNINATGNPELFLLIGQNSAGATEYYLDNIILTKIVDSTQALTKSLTISDLIEDTTYNYDAVSYNIGGNDSFSDGADSSFTTILSPPTITDIQSSNATITLSIRDNTTRNGNGIGIERDTTGGSSWVRIDTVVNTTTSYADSGDVLVGGEYKYRIINLGYNNESAYSGTSSETVVLEYQLVFSPTSINIVVDSTAAGGDGSTPVLESSTTGTTEGTTNTQIELAEPSGLENDDLILILAVTEQADSYDLDTLAGFYLISHSSNAGDVQAGIYWRIADGSESFPITVAGTTGDYMVGWCLRISGVNTSDPINQTGSWVFAQSDGLTITEVTTDVDSCLGLFLTGMDGADCSPVTIDVGVGWSIADSLADPTGDAGGAASAYGTKVIGGAGVTADIELDYTSGDGLVGIQIAIAPSTGGGSADSVITVYAINNSGGDVTLDDITGVALPITVVADSTLPETIANGDTLGVTVTIPIDSVAIHDDIAVFELDTYDNQDYVIYAKVSGLDLSDTTSPNPIASLDVIGYNEDATPKTYHVLNWVEEVSPSPDRAGYQILRCDAAGGTCGAYSAIDTVAIGTLTYTDTSAVADDTLWFQVKVYDDSSNVSTAVADSGLIPTTVPPDVPAAPSNLTATNDTATSDIEWDDNADNELGYVIERKLASVESYTVIDTVSANDTTYEFTGLAYATSYNCRVFGYNGDGNGNYSNVATFTTVDTNTVIAGTWYVDNTASGANDGSSWADAWETFSAIEWDSLGAGDILYISGGSTSKIYAEQLNIQASGDANDDLLIRAGLDAGHNGEVIIDGGGSWWGTHTGSNNEATVMVDTDGGFNTTAIVGLTIENETDILYTGTIEVVDYSAIDAGDGFTINAVTRVEGTDWDAETSDAVTATNIATDINDNVTGFTATADGDEVTVVNDSGYTITTFTDNAGSDELTTSLSTSTADGVITAYTDTSITVSALTGGTNNKWNTGDAYEIVSRSNGIVISGTSTKREYITIQKLTITAFQVNILFAGNNPTDGEWLNDITADSLTLTRWFGGSGFWLNGGYADSDSCEHIDSIFITNSSLILIDSLDRQQEGFAAKFAQNIFIDNTIIYLDNRSYAVYEDEPSHNDCMQVIGSTNRVGVHNLTITNSALTNLAGIDSILYSTKTAHGHVLQSEDNSGNYILYNNIIHAPFFFGYGAVIYDKERHHDNTFIIVHNTITGWKTLDMIDNENGSSQASSDNIYKNNIFYSDTLANDAYQYGTPSASDYEGPPLNNSLSLTNWNQVDGNLYSTNCRKGTNEVLWDADGGARDSSYIVTNGGESSGDLANRHLVNPLFVDYTRAGWPDGTLGTYDLHIQSGSPARNEGADLQSFIEGLGLEWKDKDGVARDSTPDCGAYEYVP